MRLEKERILDLGRLVDSLSTVRGVVSIILFGSIARGDYDEYSDYDLLVLFESRDAMWASWDSLFEKVGRLSLRTHVIPETLDELKSANPVFLDEIEKHGRVLFARFPFDLPVKAPRLEAYRLITYRMSGLDYRSKMRLLYRLYEKGGKGIVGEGGGFKLGEGCLLIPETFGKETIAAISGSKAPVVSLKVYVDPDEFGLAEAVVKQVATRHVP